LVLFSSFSIAAPAPAGTAAEFTYFCAGISASSLQNIGVAVLDSLCEVVRFNGLAAVKVCNGARHAQQALVAAGRGPPTRMTMSASCSGLRCRWKIDPSSLIINSEEGMVLIVSVFIFS